MLVGGQLVAPPIATTLLRHRLARDGTVINAHLSAFPWIKLIWQHADMVTARMADYSVHPGDLKSTLDQAQGIGTLEVSIGVVHTGLLRLHDVRLSKRGDEMVGDARLALENLQAALPFIQSLTPVQTGGDQLVLRGTASVLGVQASVDAVVAAQDGKLVVAPRGLLGAFASVTLFDDPQIRVQSVTATKVPGGLRFIARGNAV